MKYRVQFWDDRNDCEVTSVVVDAVNVDEAEVKARSETGIYNFPILDVSSLCEEEADAIDREKFKKSLENELKDGLETYLREHTMGWTAQRVLSKVFSVAFDRLSDEDYEAFVQQVVNEVVEEY